jgi:rhodanese-related sulfurtransferase
MRRVLPVVLCAMALCWVSAAPADDPEVPEKYMSVDEVKALLDQKKRVTFVDVRPKEQFDEEHIRGAKSIPLRELPTRLGEVPKQDLVIVYCACPHALARGGYRVLYQAGYRNMAILNEGLPTWKQKQYPMDKPVGKS